MRGLAVRKAGPVPALHDLEIECLIARKRLREVKRDRVRLPDSETGGLETSNSNLGLADARELLDLR